VEGAPLVFCWESWIDKVSLSCNPQLRYAGGLPPWKGVELFGLGMLEFYLGFFGG